MPSPNMSHWLSLLREEVVPYEPMGSPHDLIERRNPGFTNLNVDLPELAGWHRDVMLREVDGYRQTAEVYVPHGEPPFPVILHIHGGGWFTGSAEGERRFAMGLAARGNVVVNVNYRLAPEHPYPTPLEDCVYAARWTAGNIERFGGDPRRLGIGGGSAGGNLSAATVLATKGKADGLGEDGLAHVQVDFRAAVLHFGVLDVRLWRERPGYYGGDAAVMIRSYLADRSDLLDEPLVSPARSPDLGVFPPTYLSCGALDALLPQTFAMGLALTAADVPTTVSVVEGAEHEFLKLAHKLPASAAEVERITDWLSEKLDA